MIDKLIISKINHYSLHTIHCTFFQYPTICKTPPAPSYRCPGALVFGSVDREGHCQEPGFVVRFEVIFLDVREFRYRDDPAERQGCVALYRSVFPPLHRLAVYAFYSFASPGGVFRPRLAFVRVTTQKPEIGWLSLGNSPVALLLFAVPTLNHWRCGGIR